MLQESRAQPEEQKVPVKVETTKVCPHCQRTFNIKAAERHIEKCAEIVHRPKPPPTKEEIEEKKVARMLQRSPCKLRRSPVSIKDND